MITLDNMDIGFIGFGNMAGAICEGLLASEAITSDRIFACSGNYDKLCKKAEALDITPCENSAQVVEKSDIIFIAVKPYMIEKAIEGAKDLLEDKIIISVAVGKDCDYFEVILPGTAHLSTLPNTPVSVLEGIFICEDKNTLSDDQKALVEELLSEISMVKWIAPHLFGIAGTISGCGPAFASMFIEALGDAGVKYGLPRQVAYELAGQMIAGTGKLLVESGKHPAQMKDEVCSPGGTTIKGVTTLEHKGFRSAVVKAIDKIQD